ncbi:hypothetical protein [Mucilaginibacter sp.]|uniref:hypothetical protein n=1 Tax=Mucilaginibacter sp. TaxID=1882438 RepID=UPI002611969C|nr:hypothetical protein [Mucilaginibacter sp.]MDB5127375.1 hypothetical protein [Mucilaginibacter sp.]
MDQYLDNRQKEILWDLLANPADTGSTYTQSLERLVLDNPQSGILQVLLARAGNKQQLSKAAVYYSPRILHKLVNHPEDLAVVKSSSILPLADNIYINHQNNNNGQEEVIVTDEPQTEPVQDEYQDETYEEITEAPIIEEADKEIAESTEINNETDEIKTEPVIEGTVDQNPPEADENLSSLKEENQGYGSRFPKPDNSHTPEHPHHDIEDEVYDEIVSIEDIGFEAIASEEYNAPAEPVTEARFSDPTIEMGPEEEEASFVLFHQPEQAVEPAQNAERSINEQEERLILGGIVNADYLRFDKKLDELRNAAPAENTSNIAEQPQTVTEPTAETQEVSRYDDDKMPYTFMWWLNKTRKEHAGNFQPYADTADNFGGTETAVPSKMSTADELQQQYYENIFSLTSAGGVDRDADAARVEFDQNKKEDIIIERFIHTEPQIKPLSADKLDNENKAKKSSEDQDELVTETLARIYNDQMLYHKAIATYKKLILKFPEKKLYFAAQIEQLEKKTN